MSAETGSLSKTYRGPVKAVILGWGGTVVDYGSCAPAAALIHTFARRGVTVTMAQVRQFMGLMEWEQLRGLAELLPIAEQWPTAQGHPFSDADQEMMFSEYLRRQLTEIHHYADLIPGTLETVAKFREHGLKIGSTTGYSREVMNRLTAEARKRGYRPDYWISATDVPAGRPYPWMVYENAIQLQVFPLESVVKIGDTVPDIAEGLNAGMWTVGVAQTGNELGLTAHEVAALPPDVLRVKLTPIYQRLYAAGAHYVVDGIWDCVAVIDDISARLERGEQP
jgi:phosphonoacetaldehyde hydrolase